MKTTSQITNIIAGATKSKVVLLNVIAALLPVLEYAQNQIPLLRDLLPANVYMYAYMGVIVANIVLRFYTNKPLEDK